MTQQSNPLQLIPCLILHASCPWLQTIPVTMSKATASSDFIHSVQETIFQAERQHYVGKFKVKLSQVFPHPYQRSLDHHWVSELVRIFSEGPLDKAGHPIKALIDDDTQWQAYKQSQAEPASARLVADFPDGIKLLVHHGQHRVEACRRLEPSDSAWWYADVYLKSGYCLATDM